MGFYPPAARGIPAGGTANQVLAKASDVDNDTRWVTPASGGNAVVVAKRAISSASEASGTRSIYMTNGPLPASSGWAYTPLTLAHALGAPGNKLHIRVAIPVSLSRWTTAYLLLCQSGEPNAIRVSALSGFSYYYPTVLQLEAVISPGSSEPKTYTVRLGMGTRGTLYVNSSRSYVRLFGDALQATMTIEEFLP